MTIIKQTNILDVVTITPRRFGDDRGFFSETYNARTLATEDFEHTFVQDNHSLSTDPGTVRGLHYQAPPSAQGKLVRVSRGAILDIAVDIRKKSPTFGQHIKKHLSADNGVQLYVPVGFLHGFITLEQDTEVQYKVTSYYDPKTDGAVLWNSPELGIDWEIDTDEAMLSEKDAGAQNWSDFNSPF